MYNSVVYFYWRTAMQARLTSINYNEVLLYLGHRGQDVTPELHGQIMQCLKQVEKNVQPRFVYRRLPVTNGEVQGLPMEGADIRELLSSCEEAIVMAVTLGQAVETLLRRSEVTDMADAVIMDACASAAVENVCNNLEADFRSELAGQGRYLTSRFSPGYGDLPIDTQIRLCELLYTEKRIGLMVTDHSIMIPRKSVTAIMGISKKLQKLRAQGCEACNLFLTCAYRKEGVNCHESNDNT